MKPEQANRIRHHYKAVRRYNSPARSFAYLARHWKLPIAEIKNIVAFRGRTNWKRGEVSAHAALTQLRRSVLSAVAGTGIWRVSFRPPLLSSEDVRIAILQSLREATQYESNQGREM